MLRRGAHLVRLAARRWRLAIRAHSLPILLLTSLAVALLLVASGSLDRRVLVRSQVAADDTYALSTTPLSLATGTPTATQPLGLPPAPPARQETNITWSAAFLSQPRQRLAATSAGSKALFAGGGDAGGLANMMVSNRVDIYDSLSAKLEHS